MKAEETKEASEKARHAAPGAADAQTDCSVADRINNRQAKLLRTVLAGIKDRDHYRTPDGFIRWDRVENDLRAIVLQEIDDTPDK